MVGSAPVKVYGVTYFQQYRRLARGGGRGARVKGYESCSYNGRLYHSRSESRYAQELDLRVKAGDIASWQAQVKVSLDVNGMHITNYFCDFVINHNDGSEEYVEIKGFMTEIYRFKRLLMEATFLHDNPGIKYTVIMVK